MGVGGDERERECQEYGGGEEAEVTERGEREA